MSERDIFIAALQEEDPGCRRAYLDGACAVQPELRRQVEGLLRLDEGAGSPPFSRKELERAGLLKVLRLGAWGAADHIPGDVTTVRLEVEGFARGGKARVQR